MAVLGRDCEPRSLASMAKAARPLTGAPCSHNRFSNAAWSAAPTPVPARPTSSTFPANVGLTVVQLTPEQNAALNSGGGLSARPDASLLLLPLLTSSALGLLWVSTWAGQLAAS